MNIDAFKTAYAESRNGANYFVRHWAVRSFQYSDGVKQCADAGCHWLLDIVATECPKPLRASNEVMGFLSVRVVNSKANIQLTVDDDAPPVWERRVDFTDLPDGSWKFFLADEGNRFAFILPTEY